MNVKVFRRKVFETGKFLIRPFFSFSAKALRENGEDDEDSGEEEEEDLDASKTKFRQIFCLNFVQISQNFFLFRRFGQRRR